MSGKVNLTRWDVRGANLRGADPGGTYLSDTNRRNANLSSKNLRGTDLSCCDLRRANLGSTNLSGSTFGGAYLCGTMREVKDNDQREEVSHTKRLPVRKMPISLFGTPSQGPVLWVWMHDLRPFRNDISAIFSHSIVN